MKTKFAILLSILVIGSLLTACGPTTVYSEARPPQRTITVTGTGMVTMTPDIAHITISVQTRNASATVAMNDNNLQAQEVMDMVKSFGVEAVDIQTTNFSIYPQQQYDDQNNVIAVSYIVTNTVYVTVRDLETLGDLLDAVVQSGANSINGINFDVSDKTDALAQARQAAVEQARRQADELAAATGVTIGAVQTISYYDSTPYPASYELRAMDMASSVPIEAGSMQISTTVTIVYEIE